MLKVNKLNNHTEIEFFLSKLTFTPIFFFSAYTANTWLNHNGKELFAAELGSEKALILYREKLNDIRFLFREPSEQIISAAKSHFNALYIAYNDVMEENLEPTLMNSEVEIDLRKTIELSDPKVKRDYLTFKRRNPDLEVKQYTVGMLPKALQFLDEWTHTRTEFLNSVEKTVNDRRFLNTYSTDSNIKGIAVFDQDKIVALAFFVPSIDDTVIGVINKCLRGYSQLGVFTFVERAKLAHSEGFKKMCIGPVNNDFKKRFIDGAKLIPTKEKEVYRKENLNIGPRYLSFFFG